jgi:hypothetical protein
MTEKNAPTAIEAVFRITELLEAILVHLSERDILYSAQRVNSTWKACIQLSKPLQEICWLRPVPIDKDTDPLFLPLNSLFQIGWAGKAPVLDLQEELGGPVGSLRAIAKAFANGTIELHRYYLACLASTVPYPTPGMLKDQLQQNERDRLVVNGNCPVEVWKTCLHYHIDRNHLHPILRSFNHISHFWTGYGTHVILAIDEGYLICYKQLAEFTEAVVFLLQSEPPEASWKRACITRPACTKITVTGRKIGKPISLSESLECDAGITVDTLFRVIVKFSKQYFAITTESMIKEQGLKEHIECRRRAVRAMEEYETLELLRLEDLTLGTNESAS